MSLPRIGAEGSLTDRAYETLKSAILNKRLKPNQPLYEEQLAEQLGISRTPLRAALQKLEYEHLIESVSGRGLVVASLSRTDMEHVFLMRRILEPEAGHLAAGHCTEADVAKLFAIVASQEEAIAAGEYLTFLAHDREFHLAVAGISQNPYLQRAISVVQLHGHRFLVLDENVHARATSSLQEHRALVVAIEAHDVVQAVRVSLEHVEKTYKMLAASDPQ